ncbi:hypothetical protein HMPREF0880_01156 [Yokenella regensburgei ATCC 43003]|nr:hypothetical protein HMPREF0880_01156 [Yokenella regensburgei ATCC 43003]
MIRGNSEHSAVKHLAAPQRLVYFAVRYSQFSLPQLRSFQYRRSALSSLFSVNTIGKQERLCP